MLIYIVALFISCSLPSLSFPQDAIEAIKPPSGPEPGLASDLPAKLTVELPNSTYAVCVKQSKPGAHPESDYLTNAIGKSVKVYGRWMRYQCKDDGIIDVFQTQKSAVDDANNQCRAMKYRFAQPSDDFHLSSYPFQADDMITEHFRHSTPFSFNYIPSFPVENCVLHPL